MNKILTYHKKGITVYQLCVIALAAVMNIVGGQIALVLKLPIYLDCIGTIMTGALLGPVAGLFPNLIGGLVMGFTTDIYSLFFMPVGMITGFMAGIMFHTRWMKGGRMLFGSLLMTVPGTIVSALTCVVLFGGLTSSGSSLLIPLLRQWGWGETASICAVQIVTDYADRLISVFVVGVLLKNLPTQIKEKLV